MGKKLNTRNMKSKKDKNSQKVTVFKPNMKMKLVLRSALKPDTQPTISAIMDDADVTRELWYRWQKKAGFAEWWDAEWERGMKGNQTKTFLDKVGLVKSTQNYAFWEAMQMKYHGFSRKETVDTKSTVVNLDLTSLGDDEINKLAETLKKIGG